ncbi:hypothetical protein [Treponema sp. R8-4-B8]
MNVSAIKTADTFTLNDIKTSFSVAVYGRRSRPTFCLRQNVVNRH